jgi:hypothetical protein
LKKSGLEYPLQERLIDSRGKCPAYEEYKVKLKKEFAQKPIADLVEAKESGKKPAELLTKEAELLKDK